MRKLSLIFLLLFFIVSCGILDDSSSTNTTTTKDEAALEDPQTIESVTKISSQLSYISPLEANSSIGILGKKIITEVASNILDVNLSKTVTDGLTTDANGWIVSQPQNTTYRTGEGATVITKMRYLDANGNTIDLENMSENTITASMEMEIESEGSSSERAISSYLHMNMKIPSSSDITQGTTTSTMKMYITFSGEIRVTENSISYNTSISGGNIDMQTEVNNSTGATKELNFKYGYFFSSEIQGITYNGSLEIRGFGNSQSYELYGPIYKNGVQIGFISQSSEGRSNIYKLDETTEIN